MKSRFYLVFVSMALVILCTSVVAMYQRWLVNIPTSYSEKKSDTSHENNHAKIVNSKEHFTPSSLLMPPFICPGDAVVNGNQAQTSFDNGGAYSPVFFTLTVAANQVAVLTLTGANAVMDQIGACPGLAGGSTDLFFCGPVSVLLRVDNTLADFSATFNLNANIYTLEVTSIDRQETSGVADNDGILCEGDNYTLNANLVDPSIPGLTYDWDGPGGSRSGNPATYNNVDQSYTGVYTVTVTDLNGCTATLNTSITVNPEPNVDINIIENSGVTPNDGNLCVGDQLELNILFNLGNSSGATYNWVYPGGSSTAYPLILPNVVLGNNGNFNVTVTDGNGCTTTASVNISIDALPIINNTTLRACEVSPSSNTGDFVLSDAEQSAGWPNTNQNTGLQVDNGAGLTVTYHATLIDAQTNGAQISDGIYADGTIIFARVFDPSTGCFDVAQVTLDVDPLPIANNTELRACGTLSDPSQGDFFLTDAELVPNFPSNQNVIAQVHGGAGGMLISYHGTLQDALDNTGEIFDGLYNAQTIYARIENQTTGCVNTAEITLVVLPIPAVNDTELKECEVPAGSNQATFTLTDAEAAPGFPTTNSNDGASITGGNATLIVTYHNSQAAAEAGTGAVGTSVTRTDGTIIYARVEDANGCYNVAEVLLTVLESPIPEIQYMGSPSNFTICEGEMFDLDVVLSTGQSPYTYTWTTPSGGQSGSPLSFTANPTAHQGTWTVTVTDANGCTGTDDISITVDPAPSNNECGSALNIGSGFNPINISGNNICASPGGACPGDGGESAVYFLYTVPTEGLTRLTVTVTGFNVSIGPGCGSGNCTPDRETIECPDPGSQIYITISSSDANEGNFSGTVTPVFEVPDISGTVFVDLDINGTFSGTDIPLGGVSIIAYPDCDRNSAGIVVMTDADGNYMFQNLPVPPTSYLIMIDPASNVGCNANVTECVELDPCEDTMPPVDFPCPPPDCTSNPYSYDNICQDAYDNPLCDLRVIAEHPCGQNPSENGPWSPSAHCNGVYHNTSFYGFVAGSGNYSINFTIFACAGTGVQYGLMDLCNPGGPFIICDGGANTGTFSLQSDQLVPCNTYVFWIDGWAGSVCSYFVNVTGDWNNCSVPDIEDLIIDFPCDPLCPSFNPVNVRAVANPSAFPPIESITGAVYTWTVTGPNGFNFGPLEIAGPDGLNIEIPFIEAGTYNVCLETYHPCDGTKGPYCKEFTFENIEDEYRAFNLCTADFPWSGAFDPMGQPINDVHGNQWSWFGGDITLAMVRGNPPTFDYFSPYENECGCRYIQQIRVTEVPTAVGRDSIAVCNSELPFRYGEIEIRENITDSLIRLDVKSVNGCDSVVLLTARVLNMGGVIRDECVSGGIEMTFSMQPQFISQDRDSIKYVWKDNGGALLSGSDSTRTRWTVSSPGSYRLEIWVYKFGKRCLFTFNHTIDLTGRLPLIPIEDAWPRKICESSNVATYSVLNPDPALTYIWTVPSTATIVNNNNMGEIEVRWNGPTGGDICVRARNLCGEGPQLCIPIIYIDQIDPQFTLGAEICKDNTTSIIATSTHTANPVVYNWNFDGGVSANTTGQGPGPHNVSWNSPGLKTVTLSVSEDGCQGDPISSQIEVKEFNVAPVVVCGDNSVSSVEFNWNEVPGVTYSVNIIYLNSGTGVNTNNNEYTVTGMAQGDSVIISVTADFGAPCPAVTSAPQTCYANNCGSPSLTIAPIDPICLTSNTPIINLEPSMVTIDTIINDLIGVFTVNGVPSTTFNPSLLGVGNHLIGYNITWDNGRCRANAPTITVRVLETPLSNFDLGGDVCVNDPVSVLYTGGTTGGSLSWDFGNVADLIGSYNGPGPHDVRWRTPGIKTVTLTVSKDGCNSTPTTKTVVLQPLLTSPNVVCAEERLDGVSFAWEQVANSQNYSVVVTNMTTGEVIFSGDVNDLSYNVDNIPTGTRVRIVVTANSNNGCPNTQSSAECTARNCPSAVITFNQNPVVVCFENNLAPIPLTFNIRNNIANVTPTILWSSTSPGVNSAAQTFDPVAAGPGDHWVILTYQQRDCEWKDSILFQIKPKPTASFTSLDRICIEDALVVTYTGTNTAGRTLAWQDGGGTPTEITNTVRSYRFNAAGTYTIGVTTTLNECVSDPFTKQVVVEPIPDAPVIICGDRGLDYVTFNWNSVPCATSYNVFINNVPRGSQTETSFLVTGLMEMERVEIRVEAVSSCECDIPPAVKDCEARVCPPVRIQLTPIQPICNTQDVQPVTVVATVTGNTPSGSGTFSGPGIDPNGRFSPQAAGVGSHIVTYTYTDDGCVFTATTTIVVNPIPNLGIDVPAVTCYSDLGRFSFETLGGTPAYTISFNGQTFPGVGTVNNLPAGQYSMTVVDANGCTDTKNVTITIPPIPSFAISGPGILQVGASGTHELDLSGMGNLQIDLVVWVTDGVEVCRGTLAQCGSRVAAYAKGPHEHFVTIFYNNGCQVNARFSFIVTDTYNRTYPSIINPLSDVGNREFRIYTNDPSLFVKSMRVYDRWGNLVFKAENFSGLDPVGWNGRFGQGGGGLHVVPGVYVFVFEMENEIESKIVDSGDFTIIR